MKTKTMKGVLELRKPNTYASHRCSGEYTFYLDDDCGEDPDWDNVEIKIEITTKSDTGIQLKREKK